MSNSNHTTRNGIFPLGMSRKRKEREIMGPKMDSKAGLKTGFDGFKRPSSKYPKPKPVSTSTSSSSAKQLEELKSGVNNKLLAGYMATEFLGNGTFLGGKYDPARAEAAPVSAKGRGVEKKGAEANKPSLKKHQSYAEVANLLKSDGTHIPGIFNPTHLARWLQN
ncbi:hypothetical protein IFM89_007546 [Coptis chinensis]|uniref:Uncharacterized protein n=1 Tax=Coptis chinensis TaxID=261450 RepID=A0A835HXW1_9MAGN|nr:hypothetical protein IFM89_007546 [Coptis chinensis]